MGKCLIVNIHFFVHLFVNLKFETVFQIFERYF